MGMTLVIAEKPSVARALRDAIGQNSSMIVESCAGHIMELAQPEAYNAEWRRWDPAHLPIIPLQWKMEVKKDDIMDRIRVRLRGVSTVIHAGDPDGEGQRIVDEVLEHLGWTGPVLRILPNATDSVTLKRELANPQDNRKFANLGQSALARGRADWLVGMNLTRAMTKIISKEALISIGRVQTPTLALVVRRQREIDAFVQQVFYTLQGDFRAAGGATFVLRHEPDPRILDTGEAASLAKALTGQSAPIKADQKQTRTHAPMPFDLQSFQNEAEACFGWDMKRSLAALQKSYDSEFTSYPRTECRYLKEEQLADVPTLIAKVGAAIGVSKHLRDLMAPSKRIYDSKKVLAHHGLIPTQKIPGQGVDDDIIKAWKLVSAQYLRSMLPFAEFTETRISVSITPVGHPDAAVFSGLFSKIMNEPTSWLAFPLDDLIGSSRANRDKKSEPAPNVANGEMATLVKIKVDEGKTTPPKPYTQVSLGEDMLNIWKHVKDKELAARLKDGGGIGTSATRTSIISTLLARGFVTETKLGKKTILHPTELGCQVIDCSPLELHDPGITAQWEEALRMIGAGTYTVAQFEGRIQRMVIKRIDQIRQLKANGVAITAKNPLKAAGASGGAKTSGIAASKGQASAHGAKRPSTRRSRKAP